MVAVAVTFFASFKISSHRVAAMAETNQKRGSDKKENFESEGRGGIILFDFAVNWRDPQTIMCFFSYLLTML